MNSKLVVCDCCGAEFNPDFEGDLLGDSYYCDECLDELDLAEAA